MRWMRINVDEYQLKRDYQQEENFIRSELYLKKGHCITKNDSQEH
jgi:hypothetical protein